MFVRRHADRHQLRFAKLMEALSFCQLFAKTSFGYIRENQEGGRKKFLIKEKKRDFIVDLQRLLFHNNSSRAIIMCFSLFLMDFQNHTRKET